MGSQPSAPTLDTKQSASLLRQQLEIQREQLPAMSVAAGNASRQESRRNIDFGLKLLGDQRLRSSYEAALPDDGPYVGEPAAICCKRHRERGG